MALHSVHHPDAGSILYASYAHLQCWCFGLPMLGVLGSSAVDGTFFGRVLIIWILSITSVVVVAASTMIFGGREHIRNWAGALAVFAFAAFAATLGGANNFPVFVVAAALLVFATTSPFYDGVFRNHDRASIAMALTVAALSYFWTSALAINAVGQFTMQAEAAKTAPSNIRAELAIVHPGGPSVAKWVEEGRFSTPEARRIFALTPIDQSIMLVEAAATMRNLNVPGIDVAILTGSDTACVLSGRRPCFGDGVAAVNDANVVLVPRLKLDDKTENAAARAQATLITEFVLSEKSALWEVWVRRGASIPTDLLGVNGYVGINHR